MCTAATYRAIYIHIFGGTDTTGTYMYLQYLCHGLFMSTKCILQQELMHFATRTNTAGNTCQVSCILVHKLKRLCVKCHQPFSACCDSSSLFPSGEKATPPPSRSPWKLGFSYPFLFSPSFLPGMTAKQGFKYQNITLHFHIFHACK